MFPFGLTWEGHKFLDSVRNEKVMKKMRARLGGTLGEVPFTLLKELALSLCRNQIGL